MLGRPLDFSVQVRLQAGETLEPRCVSAEVVVGDRRLPDGLVNTSLLPTGTDSARIRITTDSIVDEPVVSVLLNAGCASERFSRRFVVLADPPLDPVPAALPAAPLPLAAPALAQPLSQGLNVAAEAQQPQPPAAGASDAAAATPAREGRAVLRPARAEAVKTAAKPRAPRTAASREAQRPRPARRAEPRRAEQTQARKTAAATRRAAKSEAPRLRLEAAEPAPAPAIATATAVSVDEALLAVAQAASAARAAASAAAVASARITTLEQTVKSLRTEVQAGRDVAAELRSRLARAEEAGRWTWPLLALVLLLTALAAWMAWRLNAAERARQRSWQAGAAAAGTGGPQGPGPAHADGTPSKLQTAPIPFVTSEIRVPPPAPAKPRPAWPAPVRLDAGDTEPPPLPMARATAPTPAAQRPMAAAPVRAPLALSPMEATAPMERTELLPQRTSIDDTAPRDVSIEELLDLEQQAEFFVVLGQDGAAIDLLVEHLRHTGGGSPLPYLKLLEIHSRRGEREEYERTRVRFNQRFNAYAPEWGTDLAAGRSLDTYSGVIPRLQKVWPKPLDAMAELEALLFRKSRGELFDLPAYREVLFLYSLARDLLDREAVDSGKVDLLLPLADGSEFGSTAPAPYLALESERGSLDAPATAPLDFDLSSDPGRPTSIFGPLVDEPPARGRR
ncbi:hypothetical protein IP87_01995 [beta proteobacterium AAP121]|nr:hypothetical protein IP80_02070 [beta proteobacterium AAP65]KPG00544.1 hypothetical protein IP87_01995 [beta proteobacterium AAP121]